MNKIMYSSCAFIFVSLMAWGQSGNDALYRTIDGQNNNIQNPTWGAANTQLTRKGPVFYTDGISSPAGEDRPNPRRISNVLFAQGDPVFDRMKLSDFTWVWGQFMDHDFGLTPDGKEPFAIQVPAGDPWFDPKAKGQAVIPMMRNLFDPATGTSVDNPREHINTLTAFIDGSNVYGSSDKSAAWMRSFKGGKMKVSKGNFLPYNTLTGEFDGEIDPTSPHMDNPLRLTNKLFVAGDSRANENPLLLMIHTMMVREHNYQCDRLVQEHPDWNDEQLYQHARKLVGAFIQHIQYEEWLPAMGVRLPPYSGYNPKINPQVNNEFTAAAFRLGHTLLNGNIMLADKNGQALPNSPLKLREIFFNPLIVNELGFEPFIKGMAVQMQQNMDAKVVDDVRNFLFGAPGSGGLDLVAINIQRGRERGIPDFNSLRKVYGLQPIIFFQQINTDPTVFNRLIDLYGSVGRVDAWVGLMAERPLANAIFGETLHAIFTNEFVKLREGDRFYYENDAALSEDDMALIKRTSLRDIIARNSQVTIMQDHIFEAMEHERVCSELTVDISGSVWLGDGRPVSGVDLVLSYNGDAAQAKTSKNGKFLFDPMPGCAIRSLQLYKAGSISEGVSTSDIVAIQRHVLGIATLDSPFKLLAADVDGSGAISVFDMIKIRRVILGIDQTFEAGNWHFIPTYHAFTNPASPFRETYPEGLKFDLVGSDMDQRFVAVKIGDVNNSIELNSTTPALTNETELVLQSPVSTLLASETIHSIPCTITDERILGVQATLAFQPDAIEVLGLADANGKLLQDQYALFPEQGLITFSIVPEAGQKLQVNLLVRAKKNLALADVLTLAAHGPTAALAVTQTLQEQRVSMRFDHQAATSQTLAAFAAPNPFRNQLAIRIVSAQEAAAELVITDVPGRTIYRQKVNLTKGDQLLEIPSGVWSQTSGLYLATLRSSNGEVSTLRLVKTN